MGKRVWLIDGDNTNFPNLALMKISAYHKAKGDAVFINKVGGDIDLIYASCVFSWNYPEFKSHLQSVSCLFPDIKIQIGGYPHSNELLPDHIESIMPDYDLYGKDFSMGFTSRGCIRACPFCIVQKKEGMMRPVASIYQFWNRKHDKIVLMDNNLLASPEHHTVLENIAAEQLQADFNQGLDIRLIDNDNATLLSRVKLLKTLRFAFDNIGIKEQFINGVELLLSKGIKPSSIMCYVLIGYNSTFDEDMERFEVMGSLGVSAFPMIYKDQSGKSRVRPKGKIERLRTAIKRLPVSSLYKLARFYGLYQNRSPNLVERGKE